MTETPRVTVIAPMKNEELNVAMLAEEIGAAMAPLAPFEVIFVNDGSTDDTAGAIARTRARFPWLREVRHAASCGQSAAVLSGVRAATAPLCCTLDGDGQNPPSELPGLLAPLLADTTGTVGLVAGQRVDRQDTASKRLGSRAANALRRWLLKDDTRDTGCGLKAFPRQVFLSLPFFDHIHRYLPAMVKREGYGIVLVDVTHRARSEGRSNYTNFGRALVGVLDLIGVWWLLRRRKVQKVVHADAWQPAKAGTAGDDAA
ncbi:glycosyltransferase family 2 protein [Oceanicella sp. SM1341]|uniref:glycosyltransferase family 2 protein n=1 Tax=Oceanicella sp. SM1341 TaxID=1548889 RepID=UPI000E481892|nr:glycosyltransferase family 2 protein [Oceanicella sp. SM1341]